MTVGLVCINAVHHEKSDTKHLIVHSYSMLLVFKTLSRMYEQITKVKEGNVLVLGGNRDGTAMEEKTQISSDQDRKAQQQRYEKESVSSLLATM